MNTLQTALNTLFSPPRLPAQPPRGTFPLFQGRNNLNANPQASAHSVRFGHGDIAQTTTQHLGRLDIFA